MLTTIGTSGLFVAGCLGDGDADDPDPRADEGTDDSDQDDIDHGETIDPEEELSRVREDATEVESEFVEYRATPLGLAKPPDLLEELQVVAESDDFQRPSVYAKVISDEDLLADLSELFNEDESGLADEADLDKDSLLLLSSQSPVQLSLDSKLDCHECGR